MRIVKPAITCAVGALLLAGCGGNAYDRTRPDEFAVARQAPLIVPPDFALVPPRPGEPTPASADSRSQAVQALFGGPAPRPQVESQVLQDAGADRADPGARSVVGDPDTSVVEKGSTTQAIIAAPQGAGQEATVTTPQ